MTLEELIKECNKRYPIGTIYLDASGNQQEAHFSAHLVGKRDVDFSIEVGQGYCYYYGKWAEIVKSVVPETSKQLPIFN